MRCGKHNLQHMLDFVPMIVIIRLDRIIRGFVWIARSLRKDGRQARRAMTEKIARISPLSFSANRIASAFLGACCVVGERIMKIITPCDKIHRSSAAWFFISLCVILLLSFFFFPPAADAHKVNIFAYAQDGKIYADGYFVDGTKCRNSVIEVIDAATGEKLLEGKTDDKGQASFPIPRVTALKLILRAGEGHQNDYTLSGDEVQDAMPAVKKQMKTVTAEEKRGSSRQRPAGSEHPVKVEDAVPPAVPADELEVMIGSIIERKLQPVIKMLVDLQEKSGKPKLTEIIGGIGYIIGILGIIAYFKGRGRVR